MKTTKVILIWVLAQAFGFAQQESVPEKSKDSTVTQLEEIVVVGKRGINQSKQEKTLGSVDAYLEKSSRVTMIKRGNYAWEASLNNMTTDRLSVTIDGMQIFGACTDKMDPITSYVDVSNLEQITINSGQSGNENAHCLGGSIDLKLTESKFHETGFKTSIDTGFETNGSNTSTGIDIEYSGNTFFASIDGMYRNSGNYRAGGHTEVAYSQFEKYNIAVQFGYQLNDKHSLGSHIIYDKAVDIGYPALPMDVSLAEAGIFSFSHTYENTEKQIYNWESKVYYNTITHIMDDSKRPDVPIRMDMPGWSTTFGLYSKMKLKKNKHKFSVNLNAHYNKSLAEMTMYPNNPNENEMFMYTWPDVRTLYSGVFVKDELRLNQKNSVVVSARFGYHSNEVKNEVGLQSLRIFYPEMKDYKQRLLSSFSAKFLHKLNKIDFNFGLGYGERAPTVSEGYGFFLFNSFDNYDYIGNPNLKNEKSFEANFKATFKHNGLKLGVEGSYFRIQDYIIGEVDPSLSAMTIGANGVRLYHALPNATIFNSFVNVSYKFSKAITAKTGFGYSYGKSNDDDNLPLISPLSYNAALDYSRKRFNVGLQLTANGNQTNYSSTYGEDRTPAYAILNINAGNTMVFNDQKLILKYGVEMCLINTILRMQTGIIFQDKDVTFL